MPTVAGHISISQCTLGFSIINKTQKKDLIALLAPNNALLEFRSICGTSLLFYVHIYCTVMNPKNVHLYWPHSSGQYSFHVEEQHRNFYITKSKYLTNKCFCHFSSPTCIHPKQNQAVKTKSCRWTHWHQQSAPSALSLSCIIIKDRRGAVTYQGSIFDHHLWMRGIRSELGPRIRHQTPHS